MIKIPTDPLKTRFFLEQKGFSLWKQSGISKSFNTTLKSGVGKKDWFWSLNDPIELYRKPVGDAFVHCVVIYRLYLRKKHLRSNRFACTLFYTKKNPKDLEIITASIVFYDPKNFDEERDLRFSTRDANCIQLENIEALRRTHLVRFYLVFHSLRAGSFVGKRKQEYSLRTVLQSDLKTKFGFYL
jgi:hypothetical protein